MVTMWAWLRKLIFVRPSLAAIRRRRALKQARRERLHAALWVTRRERNRLALRVDMCHVALDSVVRQARKNAEAEFFAAVGKKIQRDLETDFAGIASRAMKAKGAG